MTIIITTGIQTGRLQYNSVTLHNDYHYNYWGISWMVSGTKRYSMNYSSIIEGDNASGADDIPIGDRSSAFYLCSALVSFIAILAITVPATVVIITIAYKRDLHRYHYWFVVNLMVYDILSVLSVAPFHIALDLLKLLKVGKAMISCNVLFGIFYIPPVCSGFMVVNLAIDAALAITFPLKYENIMTKPKAVTMVVIAWVLAAFFTLPLLVSPELDEEVNDVYSCPYDIGTFLVLPVVRIFTAFTIIGFNIYLYWSTFKIKLKQKNLVMDFYTPQSMANAWMKKYKSYVRLSVTLLLIIIVRLVLAVIADYHGFSDNSVYSLIFLVAIWAEYVNHPVVYGLMLREVYQGICNN